MTDARQNELDKSFMAMHRIAGCTFDDTLLDAAVAILNREYNPKSVIKGCSNGALQFSMYVPPKAMGGANR